MMYPTFSETYSVALEDVPHGTMGFAHHNPPRLGCSAMQLPSDVR